MTLADRLSPQDYAVYIRRQTRERMARWRANHKGQKRWKPFLGCDGEGGGTDQHGRQNFLLLRIGHDELFGDNEPLSTVGCLETILAAPADAILVGYYFTYDATMILRDLPEERLRRLFRPTEPGRSPYTYWGGYAIEFRPKQYLRVARLQRSPIDGAPVHVISGSSRTINEVGGFFQKSFVAAINDWQIGTKYGRELIAATKERRSEFTEMTQAERRYCRMECEYLADLMAEFRQACHDAGMMPTAWRGAGAISAALHRDHGTPKRADLRRPKRFEVYAERAYYGGRFEVTRIGRIEGTIHEYDLSSAYPDAMRSLPCPLHTRWRPLKAFEHLGEHLFAGNLCIADVTFWHDPATTLCNLPIRQKGKLFWPRQGRGVYWSPELAAAYDAGTSLVGFHGGYYAEQRCSCTPYDWIEPLYEKRKAIGKATRGYPLKLGLNGLYGKLAQRLGGAPYRDLAAAGLITAITRAKLIRAYGAGYQDHVVMLATDAVFSDRPLPVDIGPGLGQWEHKERAGLFIVQPGIYWSQGSAELPKTRGIPRSRVIERREEFERVWFSSLDVPMRASDAIAVSVPTTDFIGHRLALARNKPLSAGCWVNGIREISFDWSGKRDPVADVVGGVAITLPYEGHPGLRSEAYDPAILSELAERELETEADDDFYPWGNSGE